MQGIEEATHKPENLRFESSNKNLLTQYVILQDGIIMCYSYGYVDTQSMKEGNDHLVFLLEQLKKGRVFQPFDMIVDFNNIKWIDKNARSILNKTFSQLFESGILRHVGIISENYIVRTMGRLWSKMSPWMNYTFYKSEINAYQEILKRRVDSAKRSCEATISRDIENERVIYYRGLKLLMYKKNNWQFHSQYGNLSITMINSRILHIRMSGVLTIQMIDLTMNSIVEAYHLLNKEKLALIFEVTQIGFPSISVRRRWFEKIIEIEDLWDFGFVIANPMVSAIFKIEQATNPLLMKRSELEISVSNALDKILNLAIDPKLLEHKKNPKDEGNFESYSKKQLIEELAKNKKNQNERINQLFELLSRISWDIEFEPTPCNVSENDAFFNVFNAVNVVQQDFFDMVQELKSLNQHLELKVKERTSLLNARNNELIHLNNELDHFVYCVSHDLRAPLSSIQGLVNLMRMEKEATNQGQYLDLVSKNIGRLDLFILEILQLSRNARLEVVREIIDFQKIIDNTFAELVYLVESGGIQKGIYIEQETTFFNDSHRITIIFRNLLSNAIKYSITNYNLPEVNIRIKIDKEKVLLKITDNGMGIMKEHLDKVFDMFYRATDNNAGSGLGLYIVKQVVTKLNGEIHLTSEVGSGTQVAITLPNLA